MSNRRWTFKKHVVLSFVATMISAISHYIFQWLMIVLAVTKNLGTSFFGGNQASSVGIISGADGPTAVYTTFSGLLSNVYSEYIFLFLVMILLYGPTKRALNTTFQA